jgi:hypothetical protein
MNLWLNDIFSTYFCVIILSTPFTVSMQTFETLQKVLFYIEDWHWHYWSVLGLFIFIQLLTIFNIIFSRRYLFHVIDISNSFEYGYLKHCRMFLHILKIYTWHYSVYNFEVMYDVICSSLFHSSLTDRFTPFKATPSKDCSCITIVYLFTFLS